jgi:hypothetical protein
MSLQFTFNPCGGNSQTDPVTDPAIINIYNKQIYSTYATPGGTTEKQSNYLIIRLFCVVGGTNRERNLNSGPLFRKSLNTTNRPRSHLVICQYFGLDSANEIMIPITFFLIYLKKNDNLICNFQFTKTSLTTDALCIKKTL